MCISLSLNFNERDFKISIESNYQSINVNRTSYMDQFAIKLDA